MKVKELYNVILDENMIISDKATSEIINTNTMSLNRLSECEVFEILAHDDKLIVSIDIEDKSAVLTEYEKITSDLWLEIFSCNYWGFDDESYNWYVAGIDVYDGRQDFRTKAELFESMESDIKEFLYAELRNGTLKTTIEDFEL